LKLENNKYYVGKSEKPNERIINHFLNNGSSFTKKYKPLEVIDMIQTEDSFDEDKHTIKMMERYGINNVRGGSFCELKLTEESIITLKKMIKGSTDKCYICGSSKHFVKDCNESNNENESPLQEEMHLTSRDNDQIEYEKLIKILKKEDKCFRCQRECHYESDCYAKTYIDGESISDKEIPVYVCEYCNKEFDTEKGARCHENLYCKKKAIPVYACEYCNKEFDTEKGTRYHENLYCKEKNKKVEDNMPPTKSLKCGKCGSNGCWCKPSERPTSMPPTKSLKCGKCGSNGCWCKPSERPISMPPTKSLKCDKCGRHGHSKNECYASMHVKGYDI